MRTRLNSRQRIVYAATKRKAEATGGSYEPTLTATTKVLGDRVEIRIRDNGTGIPLEAREKLFNPFFTPSPGDALCGSERMFDLVPFRDDLGSLWFATDGSCDRFLHRAIVVVLNFLSSVASQ